MIIQLYKIDKCGFYKRREDTAQFGHLGEWWNSFDEWVDRRRDVSATATFLDRDSEVQRVFCASKTKLTSHGAGVVLWNESPSHIDGVIYIPLESRVGDVHAESLDAGGGIPGWPTYLWFLPEQNIMVSLIADNMRGFRATGVNHARTYFTKYLWVHSPYAVKTEIEYDGTNFSEVVSGWRQASHHDPDSSLKAHFLTTPLLLQRPIDEVLNNWGRIRKIIITAKVSYRLYDDGSKIERLLNFIGIDKKSRSFEGTQHYRVEVDWTPESQEEVQDFIRKWELRSDRPDDIGFLFHRDQKVHWLGKARARDEVQVPQSISSVRVWNAEALTSAWEHARARVEAIIKESDI